MKYIAALVGAIFAIGCDRPQPHYLVVVDPSLDATGAVLATEEWEAAAPEVHFDVIVGRTDPFEGKDGTIVVKPWGGEPGRIATTHNFTKGRYDAAAISVRPCDAGDRVVVEHEIGHAIGLILHSTSGLMAPRRQPDAHVSCDDVRRFCEAWHYKWCHCGINQ